MGKYWSTIEIFMLLIYYPHFFFVWLSSQHAQLPPSPGHISSSSLWRLKQQTWRWAAGQIQRKEIFPCCYFWAAPYLKLRFTSRCSEHPEGMMQTPWSNSSSYDKKQLVSLWNVFSSIFIRPEMLYYINVCITLATWATLLHSSVQLSLLLPFFRYLKQTSISDTLTCNFFLQRVGNSIKVGQSQGSALKALKSPWPLKWSSTKTPKQDTVPGRLYKVTIVQSFLTPWERENARRAREERQPRPKLFWTLNTDVQDQGNNIHSHNKS